MPGDFLASLPITRVGSAKNITWWYVRFWCLEMPVDVCFCSKYQHRRLVLNSFESQFWAWCFSTEVDTLEDNFILCMRMCILSTPVWDLCIPICHFKHTVHVWVCGCVWMSVHCEKDIIFYNMNQFHPIRRRRVRRNVPFQSPLNTHTLSFTHKQSQTHSSRSECKGKQWAVSLCHLPALYIHTSLSLLLSASLSHFLM